MMKASLVNKPVFWLSDAVCAKKQFDLIPNSRNFAIISLKKNHAYAAPLHILVIAWPLREEYHIPGQIKSGRCYFEKLQTTVLKIQTSNKIKNCPDLISSFIKPSRVKYLDLKIFFHMVDFVVWFFRHKFTSKLQWFALALRGL